MQVRGGDWEGSPVGGSGVDAEGLHPSIKVAAVDVHQLGCAGDVSVRLCKLTRYVLPLVGFCGFPVRIEIIACCEWGFSREDRQVIGLDDRASVHDYHAL